MFGKVMSIPDTLIVRYYRLATKVPVAQIDQIEADLAAGTGDPNALKRALARTIIDNYHGAGAGELAEEAFNRVHRNREVPEDVADLAFDLSGEVYVPALLQAAGFAQSAGEGRRLIDGGGLRVDGAVVAPKTYNLPGSELDGKVVQAGKRRFVRVVALG
jgi:tyrosyl-tRNA synthetase